ncbi:hypothetical protein BpHYR1_001357 [Brachionus plicatilis]|uniref:Uncharacterized protein n=1 Tax=Brachionus plicatilis TaxID=10195 RepID=A0A3M7QMA6_BRAPC|nr:hypothetical protein BpHYR1_001357 [Brachionus plicatilis]
MRSENIFELLAIFESKWNNCLMPVSIFKFCDILVDELYKNIRRRLENIWTNANFLIKLLKLKSMHEKSRNSLIFIRVDLSKKI